MLFQCGSPEITDPDTGALGSCSGLDGLINRMHYSFQSAFEKQKFFAPVDLRYEDPIILDKLSKEREWRRCRDVLDKTYLELLNIETDKDSLGNPKRVGKGMLRYVSKVQKDRAYALLYAWVGMLVVLKGIELDNAEEPGSAVSITEMNVHGTGEGLLPPADSDGDVPGLSIHHIPLG